MKVTTVSKAGEILMEVGYNYSNVTRKEGSMQEDCLQIDAAWIPGSRQHLREA
jgi:hypothetical protein